MSLIFVSYSRADSEFVLRLVEDLRQKGVPIWLDQVDIPAGKAWDVAIEEALDNASHFLLIMSKTSVASRNVRDEINFAIQENKIVIPILLDDCRPPLQVTRLQYSDFRKDYDIALKHVLQFVPKRAEGDATHQKQIAAARLVNDTLPQSTKAEISEPIIIQHPNVGTPIRFYSAHESLSKLLDELYKRHLSHLYDPFTYGQSWLLVRHDGDAYKQIAIPWDGFKNANRSMQREAFIRESTAAPEKWGLVAGSHWTIMELDADNPLFSIPMYGLAVDNETIIERALATKQPINYILGLKEDGILDAFATDKVPGSYPFRAVFYGSPELNRVIFAQKLKLPS